MMRVVGGACSMAANMSEFYSVGSDTWASQCSCDMSVESALAEDLTRQVIDLAEWIGFFTYVLIALRRVI